jgi:hypothetical protein
MIATLVAASLLVGCKAGARATFDKMHAAACSGDDDKFFAHVADDALSENLIKRARGKLLGSVTSDELVAGTAGLGAGNLQSIYRTAALSALEDWRKDISQKRNDGDLCGWAFVGVEKIGDQERVEVKSQAGNKKYLYFATIDGQAKLVDFQPLEEPGRVSNAADASPGPEVPSVPGAMDVCQRLADAGVAADCMVDPPGKIRMRAGTESVSYRIPAFPYKGEAAWASVFRAPDDEGFLGMLNDPNPANAARFASRRARILVYILGTVVIPPDVRAKTEVVVDGL